MYRLFKSLFVSHPDVSTALPKGLLDAAIERTVDGTDRRLRALSGYRRHLRVPVAQAVRHVIDLVAQLPDAGEISPGQYGSDPRLRAAFASPGHLSEVLRRFQTVRDYLDWRGGTLPDEIYGLLIMSRRKRRVLGMELDGTYLKRDVLQTAVSFSDHRYIAPADTECATRRELEKQAFDFLLERAAERIGAEKLRRGDMLRNRQLLRRQVEAMKSRPGRRALSTSETVRPGRGLNEIEAEIERIDARLGRSASVKLSLDESLQVVIDTLNRGDQFLMLQPLSMNIDHRGIEIDSRAHPDEPIEMNEVSSPNGFRRIVLLGRIPRCHLSRPGDTISRGEAYLGLPSGG